MDFLIFEFALWALAGLAVLAVLLNQRYGEGSVESQHVKTTARNPMRSRKQPGSGNGSGSDAAAAGMSSECDAGSCDGGGSGGGD